VELEKGIMEVELNMKVLVSDIFGGWKRKEKIWVGWICRGRAGGGRAGGWTWIWRFNVKGFFLMKMKLWFQCFQDVLHFFFLFFFFFLSSFSSFF
jgi:hypothetical protein